MSSSSRPPSATATPPSSSRSATPRPSRLTKPELGHLKAAGAPAQKYLVELRVDDLSNFELGQVLQADVFAAGERVDVTGISKGHGFSGVMKRHNFYGQGASHGNHKKHRAPGAIGACATPARVFKGVRMAGQYGNTKVTTLNLEVVEGDAERGLLLIKGSVPGANGGVVFVRNAVKAGVASVTHARRRRTASGAQRRRSVELPDDDLRHRAERRGDAPGRHRAARGQARRDAQHQDPRRGAGRWREAVAAEGHRPGPSGLDPLAAVARRWCGARPEAARLLAADAEEDGEARAPFGAVRPRGREKVIVVDDWGDHRAEDQGGRAGCSRRSVCATKGERAPRVLARAVPHRGSVWKSFRNLGERVQIVLPEELNTYDVLVNDWLVFSQASLDATVARLTDGTAAGGDSRR